MRLENWAPVARIGFWEDADVEFLEKVCDEYLRGYWRSFVTTTATISACSMPPSAAQTVIVAALHSVWCIPCWQSAAAHCDRQSAAQLVAHSRDPAIIICSPLHLGPES